MSTPSFSAQVIAIIQSIPPGSVMTYGQVAQHAGNPRGARQVVRLLHSASEKHRLPWHRVLNRFGELPLPDEAAREEMRWMLESEGISVSHNYRIDLEHYRWHPPLP